jgi:ABC-type polysaccharide/polyol phosphate export permease
VPAAWSWLLNVNPLALVISAARAAWQGGFDPQALMAVGPLALLLLGGLALFQRYEDRLGDLV